MKAPDGLGAGGKALWKSIADDYDLDATQLVQLHEACRAKDRCDLLDGIMAEAGLEPKWLKEANATANLLKQLLAALRLPDPKTGKRPQYRGPRGALKPGVPGGATRDRLRAVSA